MSPAPPQHAVPPLPGTASSASATVHVAVLGQPAVGACRDSTGSSGIDPEAVHDAHRQPALVEAQLRDPEFCERHAEAYDPASVER